MYFLLWHLPVRRRFYYMVIFSENNNWLLPFFSYSTKSPESQFLILYYSYFWIIKKPVLLLFFLAIRRSVSTISVPDLPKTVLQWYRRLLKVMGDKWIHFLAVNAIVHSIYKIVLEIALLYLYTYSRI